MFSGEAPTTTALWGKGIGERIKKRERNHRERERESEWIKESRDSISLSPRSLRASLIAENIGPAFGGVYPLQRSSARIFSWDSIPGRLSRPSVGPSPDTLTGKFTRALTERDGPRRGGGGRDAVASWENYVTPTLSYLHGATPVCFGNVARLPRTPCLNGSVHC